MTLTTAQIIDEIVAIKVCEPLALGGSTRGGGVTFWCDVSGVCKLVTAAHLPWPSPRSKPQNEILYVYWATKTLAGKGEAIFTPHTPGSYPDFADISFIDQSNSPPRNLVFPTRSQMPAIGDQVACVGFPGPFAVPPSAARINGAVKDVKQGTLSVEALVNGPGTGGYSGGPVFLAQPNGNLDDQVVGLMSGAPPLPGAVPDAHGNIPHDPTKWVFFAAVSFK
jgi:hypothetical protein